MMRSSQAWTAGQWLARNTSTTTSSFRSDRLRLVCSPLGAMAGIPEKVGALSPGLTTLFSAKAGADSARTTRLSRTLRIDAHSICGWGAIRGGQRRSGLLISLERPRTSRGSQWFSKGSRRVRPAASFLVVRATNPNRWDTQTSIAGRFTDRARTGRRERFESDYKSRNPGVNQPRFDRKATLVIE